MSQRIDTASAIIKASPARIYHAIMDKKEQVVWRPPSGMEAEIYSFDAREGGSYRMTYKYKDKTQAYGKTTDDADVFEGKFIKLVPGICVVEEVKFKSDDPSYAHPMTITTTLKPVEGGTEVTFTATNVPKSISKEDHKQGMESTLQNLAKFVE